MINRTLLPFLDWVLLNISIFLAHFFYFGSYNQIAEVNSIYLLIYSNLSWLFLALVSGYQVSPKSWTLLIAIKDQFLFLFIHSIVVAFLIVSFHKSYSPSYIVLIYAIFTPLIISLKTIYFLVIQRRSNATFIRYIIIGSDDVATDIRRFYLLNSHLNFRFYGYYDLTSPADLNHLRHTCSLNKVDQIFCCKKDMDRDLTTQLINFGLDHLIQIRLIAMGVVKSYQLLRTEAQDLNLPSETTIKLDDYAYRTIKRFFDISFSLLIVFFVLSWLIPIVAFFIKMDSKGPVFFIQMRTGKSDRQFRCIKFRTMVVNKDADTKQAVSNDPRITFVGKFLRRTCLDEFPQFVNVLLGSMSVVGPRPFMVRHREEYSKLIESFMGRHYVKPGVTGLAQCLGFRGEIKGLEDMENRVRLDRHYIETWTFWLDIKIIFLTVVSLLREGN
ncbi:MAG: exopolysaccharide biosynthesis polyprenyl glycosylphosphotransferase [Cyclobacteriaceae bacterium]|nr:exopolysaccharide biosynthesis polyprenyl glycosylphosphotransferase [Cyclobacteriaceae bacterium]